MDSSANKALTIGVALFVTIIVTSGVFLTLNQMKDVYSEVYETDISIQSRFGEYEAFDNTSKTGIEVVNAINKYVNNYLVTIKIGNSVVLENGSMRVGSESTLKQMIINTAGTQNVNNVGEVLLHSQVSVVDDFATITFTRK